MKALVLRIALIAATAVGLSVSTSAFADDNPTLFQGTVLPPVTDPAIQGTDAHYFWFNPSASNGQLLVYLPGNSGVPKNALLFQQEAAQLGYHVIGLAYETRNSLSALCNADPDPNTCFYDAHFEVTYGVGSRLKYPVNEANSIVHRLTALLEYLANTYPDQGWSHFLAHGSPRWSSIALSGLSQGAGNSAMIAKYRLVRRVVMLSGVTDAIPGPQPCVGADDWLTDHRTPTARYWGLGHDRDPNYPSICSNWNSLGLARFGPLVKVDNSTPPYSGTHQLFTDLRPQDGYAFAHPSTVADIHTPLNPDGKTPTLTPAWDYLLTASADDETDYRYD